MKTRAKSKKKDQTTSSFLPQNSLTDGAPSSKTKIETPAPATIQNPNPQKVKVQNQRQALPKKQQNTACLTRTANSISSSTEADRASTKADRETTKAYDDEVSKRYNTRSRANPPTSSSTKVASITPNLEIQHAAKQDSIVPSTSAELSTSSSTNSTIPEASPTSSDRVTLTTFHLFKKLANELKTMIWAEAIQEWDKHIIIWRSPVVPPLLHTCRLSRALFLSTHQIERWEYGPRTEVLFVNWERNMVHFPSRIPGVEDGDFVPKRITKPVQIGDTWVPHIPSKPQTDENLLHLIRYLLVTNTVQRRIMESAKPDETPWELVQRKFPKLKKSIMAYAFNRKLRVGDTTDDVSVKGLWCLWPSPRLAEPPRIELAMLAFRRPEDRDAVIFESICHLFEHLWPIDEEAGGDTKEYLAHKNQYLSSGDE